MILMITFIIEKAENANKEEKKGETIESNANIQALPKFDYIYKPTV